MGGGAWWAAVHGVVNSRTRLSDFTVTFHFHALEQEERREMGFGATFICRFGNRKLTKFQSHKYCFLCQVENGEKSGSGIKGLNTKERDCFPPI